MKRNVIKICSKIKFDSIVHYCNSKKYKNTKYKIQNIRKYKYKI